MSTILKALEKNKRQTPSFIDKSSDNRWKLVAVIALVTIAILFSIVIYLLVKPTPKTVLEVPVKPIPIIEALPEVESNAPSEAPESLVGVVHFDTAPLTLALENEAPKWIKADLNEVKKPTSKSSVATQKTNNESSTPINEDVSVDDISAELRQRFALAVELEQGKKSSFDLQPVEEGPVLVASDISSMPAKFQYQVPVMRYDSHVYSTIEKDRWIRINGVDLRVGDRIGDIELLDILPQQSVFRLGKQSFTLESLEDWEG